MRGAIPTLPQYVFMVWYLVKQRDNFTRNRGAILETATPSTGLGNKSILNLCAKFPNE
jgi:hypothetical protein